MEIPNLNLQSFDHITFSIPVSYSKLSECTLV
uniref:Uncharacterized protein n=1 Tax=Rhizophora mucronata TaxID=61149 RepID=A0A2P2P9U5_RHIMU